VAFRNTVVNGTGTGASLSAMVGTATAAGASILVGTMVASGATVTGVTDTKGNVYVLDAAATSTGQNGSLWRCQSSVALATTDMVTITQSGTAGLGFAAAAYDPLPPLRGAATAVNLVGTGASSGVVTYVGLWQVSDLAVAICATVTGTSAGVPSVGTARFTSATMMADFVPSAATPTESWTWTTNSTSAQVLAVYGNPLRVVRPVGQAVARSAVI
jgi:hypothetical protein